MVFGSCVILKKIYLIKWKKGIIILSTKSRIKSCGSNVLKCTIGHIDYYKEESHDIIITCSTP